MREVAGNDIEILQKRTNVLADNEVLDLLDAVVEQLGRVDYCANCAGMLCPNHSPDVLRLPMSRNPQRKPTIIRYRC
jgi:NAD(P)-dependent dehydrogenase (short-subunit alcohol dehydrogenase family)